MVSFQAEFEPGEQKEIMILNVHYFKPPSRCLKILVTYTNVSQNDAISLTAGE
jgi:hypothetical protein